jgi:mannosyltransferase
VSSSEYPVQRPLPVAGARVRAVPADVWAVWALVMIATVIRLLTINNQSFWTDEALTAYEAHVPFGAMLNSVMHVETTPPLYFVLVWAWAHVVGIGEVALRTPSMLAGVVLVPIAYLSARELASRWAGVIAAALVTVNPFLIWYSQEARAYMLLTMLCGASLLWFARARRDPSRRNLAWWAALSCLAVMTHFFAGFAIAPEALWLLWRAAGPGRAHGAGRARPVLIAVGVVAAVQAAMLPFAVADTSHGVGWIASTPRMHRIGQLTLEWGVSVLSRQGNWREGLAIWALLAALVILLLRLGGTPRERDGARAAAAITGFVFLVPLALGFLGEDYFLSRNEIPAMIPLLTLLAAACAAPRARLPGSALAVALLVIFSVAAVRVQTDGRYQRPDWRKVARALGPATRPRAILAADGATGDPLKVYLPGVNWTEPRGRRVLISEIDVIGALKRLPLAPLNHRSKLGAPPRPTRGRALPSLVPPPGTRLIARARVASWVIARYAFAHPQRFSIQQIAARAPEYFHHAPASLLAFTQPAD